jgi:hypothetical protein
MTVLTQCAENPESVPAQAPAPAASASSVARESTAPLATAAPSIVATRAPPAAGYPMCAGQHVPAESLLPRSGAISVQLAPAFLDEMASCKAEDSMPKDLPGRAGDGRIDQKGDCAFASVGVSCHYHSGSEFIASSAKGQLPGQGELHCIVPSADPKSPSVFGAHVTCSDPRRGKPAPEQATGEIKTGAACSAAVLTELASCQSAKCCNDGTLTNVIGDLIREGRNDVRPDFRICEQSLELDCSLLENWRPHTANAPALGGVGKPVFVVAPEKGNATGRNEPGRRWHATE